MSESQRTALHRLVDQASTGNVSATARLISLALGGGPEARQLSEVLLGRPRTAHVVGVTGPPGAGKSTLVGALANSWPGEGRTAILAIDPSSPMSGGSILGDRVRMKQLSGNPRVYVRSIASHGRTDGLALGIERAADVLGTLDFDTVLIETVGIGQVEIEITSLADTTVAVFTPGQGDIVQALKAGLNEVADIFVVNKIDLGGADGVIRDLRRMTRTPVDSAIDAESVWQRPVDGVSASEARGVSLLLERIADHRHHLVHSGEGAVRRDRRGRIQIEALLNESWNGALADLMASDRGRRIAGRVAVGEDTSHEAAAELFAEMIRVVHEHQRG